MQSILGTTMTKLFIKKMALGMMLLTFLVTKANAAIITSTLPEVNGGNGVIGDFVYSIPVGDVIVSATLEGTFGNSVVSNSGALTLFLDNILVAECVEQASCWFTQTPEPFSYSFSSMDLMSGVLDDGVATLVQNATAGTTRLGGLTLTIETMLDDPDPVSAPGMIALLIGGCALVFAKRKS